jgi:hypothetical protein
VGAARARGRSTSRSLPALLGEAIEQVTDDHQASCGVLVDHPVLGDSVLVLGLPGGRPGFAIAPAQPAAR